jgi:molybdate transport system permease protein
MRPIRAPGGSLPRWVYLPAALGAIFVALPLVGIIAKVDWSRFIPLVTSPASRAALLLSLQTATVSTLLCLVLARHFFADDR